MIEQQLSQQDQSAWNIYRETFNLSPHCGYTWFDLAPQIQTLYRIEATKQMLDRLAPWRH